MATATFQSITRTAARLGLPEGWLRREVKAGRVPHLRAGRRLLLDPEQVARVLHERTHQVDEQATSQAVRCG